MSQPPGTGPYIPPGMQGPYVPPGTQGPYVPPGTPGQVPWPAQSMAPAWSSPPPSPTAPQPRSPRGWFAAVAIVAGLALVFGATFFLGRLTSPRAATPGATTTGSTPSAVVTTTPSPTSATSTAPTSGTPTKGFTFRGSSLIGSDYTATLPNGWVIAADNGDNQDGSAEGPSGGIIYWAGGTTRAATLCPTIVLTVQAAPTDVATDVTGVRWGALDAVAKDVVTKNKETGAPVAYTLYCADLPTGTTSVLLATSSPADQSTHKKVVAQFLATWTWR
jgi:hypothetical protein